MSKNKVFIKPVLKSFNCPSCGATLDLKAVGISVSVACPSCRTLIDANNPSYQIIEKANNKKRIKPSIPLGSRGKLSGKVYEVIGFMERREGIYPWNEYLLYNPYIGFKWLSEVNGHWSFIKRIRTLPEEISNRILKYKGKTFKLFNQGSANVSYVEGEFYWRVKIDQKNYLSDFICPPYVLSREHEGSEVSWSLGTYMEPERIERAFKLKKGRLKTPEGVGANQPSPNKERFREIAILASLSFALCLLIHVLRVSTAGNEVVFSSGVSIPNPTNAVYANKRSQTKPEVLKTNTFRINEHGKNVKFRVNSNIYNSWIYLDTLLVNESTGKGIPMPLELSYYRGSDWSEGSQTNDLVVYNVPAGNYYLNIKFQIPLNFSLRKSIAVELTSDTPIGSNLIWVLFGIFIPFIFAGMRSRSFERKRWENGSENPYADWES